MTSAQEIERRLGDWLRAWLPIAVTEFIMFGVKMGWASLFGGLLLLGLIASNMIWQANWPISRYDALVIYAVGLQIAFLVLRLETLSEAKVILLFHITGTAMEIFKLHMGSWDYPGEGHLEIAGVPLFSGFMYASVGSFMARSIRLFNMRFTPYPPFWSSVLLATLIYVNFFAHHYLPDIRIVLFAATVLLFARTRIYFRVGRWFWMPLPFAAFLSSFFLWIAENVGTYTATWIYSGQSAHQMVSFAKLGSWYLLLYVSFVSVTLVMRSAIMPQHSPPK